MLSCVALLLAGQVGVISSSGEASGASIAISGLVMTTIDGKLVGGAVAGQQVLLKLTLISDEAQDFVAILDLRDETGVSMNLQWQSGTIDNGVPSEAGFSWIPPESGEFQARAFVLSSLESPTILSEVSGSDILIVDDASELPPPPEIEAPVVIDETPELPSGPAAYTFLVYMVASDLESSGYYATEDIKEMMTVGTTPNVNVVIQTGGSANSTIDEHRFIDFTKVQRHLVLKDETKLIQDLGERNMGTSATLREFVSWGIKAYPADKYVMVLWDHGAGILGFGFDNIHLDVLDLDELRVGLDPAMLAGKKFEVIGFDACLMASIEVANALTGRGSYLVASEELGPAWGWDYSAVISSLDENPMQDGAELGKTISDSYMIHGRENAQLYENYDSDKGLTMSVIDLAEIPNLIEEVYDVGERFDRFGGDLDITHSLTKTIRATERYGEGGKSSAGHLDLYHFADNVDREFPELRGIGATIKSGVDKAVVYKVSGDAKQDSHGISIFMQVEEYEGNAHYLRYIAGKWISVMTFARQTLDKDELAPVVSLSMRNDETITGKIGGNDVAYVSTFVTQDVESSNLRLKVLSIVDEDASEFIRPDALGFISYNWSRQIMSLCNQDENDCKEVSITLEKNGNTKFAYLQVRLESDRFNGTLFLIYTVDSDGKFEFLGGWPGLDEYGNAIRELVPLLEGDRVYTTTYIFRYDPLLEETYFDTVEEPTPIIVGEGFGPMYHGYSGEYRLFFTACDFSGNCGYSEDFIFEVE